MEIEISKNLVFLADNLGNLERILLLLEENGIISTDERHRILLPGTLLDKNTRFFDMIKRKDCNANKNLIIEVLRMTNNEHCADKIEGTTSQPKPIKSTKNTITKRLRQMFKAKDDKSKDKPSSSNAIAKCVITNSTTETTSNEMPQPIWFGVTAANRFYTGRQKEMKLLEKYWNDCLTRKTFSMVAVTGLGGVGKSELAKNFAKWFHEVVGGHCIWADAETPQALVESFQNLAKEFKVALKDHLGKERHFQEIVKEVYEKLFGQKVLFVFDNLENYELPVLNLLFDLSAKKPPTVLKPFVVTTSRFVEAKKHFGSQCNQLNLEVLTKPSAINFFYKSLSIIEPPEETLKALVDRLCERLQFYPLAMQQALAFIAERVPSNDALSEAIQIYLDKMENISKDLLNYELPQYDALESTSKTTLVTWRITFQKLGELSGGLAVDIMNIISFLAPDNIPALLVIKILEKTKNISNVENVEIIFDVIRKYSMITSPDVKIKEMSVHRLVQEVTRIELGERGELQSVLTGIVRSMIAMLEDEEISLKELIHAQMVWQHLGREKDMVDDDAELPDWICSKLGISGKYRDVLDFSGESFGLVNSVLGQNRRLALKMKFWEGEALDGLGEYSESMEVLKDTFEKQKETFGEEDEDSLDTAQLLGAAYWRLNRNEEALETYKNILEKTERVFGKEGRRTLFLKHNIALVLESQNKKEEALELYAEVLEVKERFLGVEHPDTLSTKHNIATVKLEQGDYLEALKLFQEVLEIQERVLKLNHPDTLSSKYFIAMTYYHLGRHEESFHLFKEVHEHCLRILGPRHPHTINTEEWIEDVETEIAKSAESEPKSKRKCAVQ